MSSPLQIKLLPILGDSEVHKQGLVMQAGDDEEPVAVSNVVLDGNQLTAEIEGQRHKALLSTHSYLDELVTLCYSAFCDSQDVNEQDVLPDHEL